MNRVEAAYRAFRAESSSQDPDPSPAPSPKLPLEIPRALSVDPAPSSNSVLQSLQLDRGRVAAIAARSTAPSLVRQWTLQRRAVTRLMVKGVYGRRGIPEFVVQTMYRDYLDLGSLSKTARIYRRMRQSMWQIFHDHGLKMNSRRQGPRIIYRGQTFTCSGKDGAFRSIGDRRLLHHVIWEDRTGQKIPRGNVVSFRNGDRSDLRYSNLICGSKVEISLYHQNRRYPERAHFTREQLDDYWRAHNRDYMRRKSAEFVRQGLRTDGKSRRRPVQMKEAA